MGKVQNFTSHTFSNEAARSLVVICKKGPDFVRNVLYFSVQWAGKEMPDKKVHIYNVPTCVKFFVDVSKFCFK